MLGAKLIIKPKKGERSLSYADFLPSIHMVTGLRIFMISQATTSKKFWKKVGLGFELRDKSANIGHTYLATLVDLYKTHFYNDIQHFISLYMKRREVSY